MSLQDLRNNPHYQISYAKSVIQVSLQLLSRVTVLDEMNNARLEEVKRELCHALESLREWTWNENL